MSLESYKTIDKSELRGNELLEASLRCAEILNYMTDLTLEAAEIRFSDVNGIEQYFLNRGVGELEPKLDSSPIEITAYGEGVMVPSVRMVPRAGKDASIEVDILDLEGPTDGVWGVFSGLSVGSESVEEYDGSMYHLVHSHVTVSMPTKQYVIQLSPYIEGVLNPTAVLDLGMRPDIMLPSLDAHLAQRTFLEKIRQAGDVELIENFELLMAALDEVSACLRDDDPYKMIKLDNVASLREAGEMAAEMLPRIPAGYAEQLAMIIEGGINYTGRNVAVTTTKPMYHKVTSNVEGSKADRSWSLDKPDSARGNVVSLHGSIAGVTIIETSSATGPPANTPLLIVEASQDSGDATKSRYGYVPIADIVDLRY